MNNLLFLYFNKQTFKDWINLVELTSYLISCKIQPFFYNARDNSISSVTEHDDEVPISHSI